MLFIMLHFRPEAVLLFWCLRCEIHWKHSDFSCTDRVIFIKTVRCYIVLHCVPWANKPRRFSSNLFILFIQPFLFSHLKTFSHIVTRFGEWICTLLFSCPSGFHSRRILSNEPSSPKNITNLWYQASNDFFVFLMIIVFDVLHTKFCKHLGGALIKLNEIN